MCAGEEQPWIENLLIPAATESAQKESRRQFLTATWQIALDCFPHRQNPVYLPLGNFQSLVSIAYLDADYQPQTLDPLEVMQLGSSDYPRLVPGTQWPDARRVSIDWICGYGDTRESLPSELRLAIALIVKHHYDEGRQNVVIGATVATVPDTAHDMLAQFCLGDVFRTYDTTSEMYRAV